MAIPQRTAEGYNWQARAILVASKLDEAGHGKSQAIPHGAEHTHLARELNKPKGTRREGGPVAGPRRLFMPVR